MKIFIVVTLALISITLFSDSTSAQGKPIQLALFNPVQIVPETQSISGLRLTLLYGRNTNVTGVDIGLANFTTSDQLGIQWGGVGYTEGDFTGWQGNWVSISKGNFVGLQSGLVTYNARKENGLQFALVNYAAKLNGLQLGLINIIGEGGFLPTSLATAHKLQVSPNTRINLPTQTRTTLHRRA